jgi:glycosyltransferase involved in cell wall biosynthesis
MRVLQLGPLYNNHVRRWSANAVAAGAEVHAAGHVRPGRLPVDLRGVATGVEVMPPELLEADEEAQLEWLRGALARVRPDVVHAHWLPRWGQLATRSGHEAVVVTPWGSDVYESAGPDRARADRALRGAQAVIARSRHMEHELLARGAPAGRVHRVDLGVDLARFSPPAKGERDRLRARLGLPEGPVILSFRAGTELYNLDVVVRAAARVRERRPDATLVLVHGDAPLAASVRDALRDAPGVRAVGHVPYAEMPVYLRAASAGVSIPRSDGSPSSVWEALACGVPVVASNLPQIEERVGTSGAVRLVPARDEAVAAALLDVLDRHEEMARAARAWAEANADQAAQVERLARLYAVVSGPRPGPPPAREPAGRPRGGRAPAAALPRRPS